MKNFYLLLAAFLTMGLCYSQTVIVTVDRANGAGPTATGNDPTISSIGLTRGSGVSQTGTPDFSSRRWDGTSQAQAEASNEYIQWSTKASPSNSIEITEINLRLRRNAQGPSNWQLFYSTDGFSTTGTPINGVVTIPATTDVNYNYNGLSIISGTGQTITFRLYAWNSTAPSGFLRLRSNIAWADFGINYPGVRLIGNIIETTPNSIESNIITSSSFDPNDNIDYQLYSATSGLTVANAVKIGEFVIQDGGDDLTDDDTVATILTDLDLNVDGFENIAALALFDGSLNVAESSTVDALTSFNSISGGSGIIAGDNSTKNFDVYATFNTSVTDNDQIQLTIASAIADAVNGSSFLEFDAGGASTTIIGDDNRLEVSATELVFVQQTSDVSQFEVMAPFPIVNAIDSNGNLDVDFNDTINVIASGPLDPPSIFYDVINGIGVFNTIVFSEQDTGIFLVVIPSDLPTIFSNTFDVTGPLVTIAIQDFDNTNPEWAYFNDIVFFDNNWGTDGYYGVIDITSASPLNNELFSNNILGENDLNDEGNGTNSFATISFDVIDITNYNNVQVRFDWQVIGYTNSTDDAIYEVFYDGIGQGNVYLVNGGMDPEDGSGSILINVPDTVNSVSLEIRIRNNDTSGFSGFDNFRVVSVFDGLIYADNGWSPFPPSDTSGSENALIKDGNYIVGTDIVLNNLFINDGAAVNVSSGQSIILNEDLLNGGTVQLNSVSTSYSSLIVNGSTSGNVRYSRFTNQTASSGGNDLISAPVSGQTFGDFAAVNTNLFENPLNTTEKLFGPFDKVTNSYLTYDTAISAEASVILTPGVGYRAATSDGSNLLFEGIANNGSINVSILNTGPTYPEWNLVGNPYPSYLSLSNFLTPNTSELDPTKAAIYGYDGDASNGWTVWNQAYADANPGAKIAPGQGFLLASASGGGTILFTPSMRTIGTNDDFIPGTPNDGGSNRDISPILQLKLDLSTDTKLYHTNFYITDNASLGLDVGYDAATFGNVAPQFSIYSHLVQENAGLDMAVQSISFNDLDNEVIIPLGINAVQGQQVTVSIGNTDFPADIEVYLEDNLTNTFTLLTASDYTFTANTTLSDTGRFFLRLSRETLSTISFDVDSLNIFTTKTPNALFVKGLLNGNTSLQMYDIRGRLVLVTDLDSAKTSNQVNLDRLNSGVYVVKLINKNYVKSQKVVIH